MDYKNYQWIKVKRFQFDPAKSWEENFKSLEQHHLEETAFLIDEVRKLAAQLSKEQPHGDG